MLSAHWHSFCLPVLLPCILHTTLLLLHIYHSPAASVPGIACISIPHRLCSPLCCTSIRLCHISTSAYNSLPGVPLLSHCRASPGISQTKGSLRGTLRHCTASRLCCNRLSPAPAYRRLLYPALLSCLYLC